MDGGKAPSLFAPCCFREDAKTVVSPVGGTRTGVKSLGHSLEGTCGWLHVAVEDGTDGHPAEIGPAGASESRRKSSSIILPDAYTNVDRPLEFSRAGTRRTASACPMPRNRDNGVHQSGATYIQHCSHALFGPMIAQSGDAHQDKWCTDRSENGRYEPSQYRQRLIMGHLLVRPERKWESG